MEGVTLLIAGKGRFKERKAGMQRLAALDVSLFNSIQGWTRSFQTMQRLSLFHWQFTEPAALHSTEKFNS
eukprot:scaffold26093_cov16-Tisochrysis_lutea.AAC.4